MASAQGRAPEPFYLIIALLRSQMRLVFRTNTLNSVSSVEFPSAFAVAGYIQSIAFGIFFDAHREEQRHHKG